MSWRVNLDSEVINKGYDWFLSDYDSLLELANKCAWQLPLKIFYRDFRLLRSFMKVLRREHHMKRDDYSVIRLGADDKFYVARPYSLKTTRNAPKIQDALNSWTKHFKDTDAL